MLFIEKVCLRNFVTMADFDLAATFIPSLHKPASLLPIARHRQSLLYLIESYPVTIVVGQTGSGKTTQIPQYLEQAGWCAESKVIAVTQVNNHINLRVFYCGS
jgi:ATP-dependent RNA helicase DDX35